MKFPILVFNSGSSSLKYQLIELPAGSVVLSGQIEQIGQGTGKLSFQQTGKAEVTVEKAFKDHKNAIEELVPLLSDFEVKVVAHRIVHGGELFSQPTVLTPEVLKQIDQVSHLAPLHNPANLLGVQVAQELFPETTQVGIFDTAFHQSMPEVAYRYAIPNELYTQHGVRKYGMHGTSHKYVSKQTSDYLNRPEARLIVLHLGNGCSATAVSNGKSIETSMGLGPLAGLVMGTRSGDVDPTILFFLHQNLGYSLDQIDELLNKKSGLFGLAGNNDMRSVIELAETDKAAQLALDLYVYRIQQYIGSYLAVLGGLDALVFTAGVGENSALIREKVVSSLGHLGLTVDLEKNKKVTAPVQEIQEKDGSVKVLVVKTNEELEIARQAYQLCKN